MWEVLKCLHVLKRMCHLGTSLVVQWWGVCLSMQGTGVWSLVWEEQLSLPAATTEPTCHSCWACVLQLLMPACLEPELCSKRGHPVRCPCTAMRSDPCSLQLEKAHGQRWRPNTAKKKRMCHLDLKDLLKKQGQNKVTDRINVCWCTHLF